jgi:hypothetical protein
MVLAILAMMANEAAIGRLVHGSCVLFIRMRIEVPLLVLNVELHDGRGRPAGDANHDRRGDND